jgi:hypothetical protein
VSDVACTVVSEQKKGWPKRRGPRARDLGRVCLYGDAQRDQRRGRSQQIPPHDFGSPASPFGSPASPIVELIISQNQSKLKAGQYNQSYIAGTGGGVGDLKMPACENPGQQVARVSIRRRGPAAPGGPPTCASRLLWRICATQCARDGSGSNASSKYGVLWPLVRP